MPEQKFANGTTVMYKSGGPVMTVAGFDVYEDYSTEKKYKCRWFEGKHLNEQLFTEAELEPALPPVKPGFMFEMS